MDSTTLQEEGFTAPIPFVLEDRSKVPKKIGIYIITIMDGTIDYSWGRSDIVKIGKVETKNGFYDRWYSYLSPGPSNAKGIRLKKLIDKRPHGFAYKELPKGAAEKIERRLIARFQEMNGQKPAYNMTNR